ncbi:LuxR C-terminal-related transcriptional regulator [Chloroflexota bacterium]
MPADDFPDGSRVNEQSGTRVCVVAPAPVLQAGLRAIFINIEGIDEVYEVSTLEEFESFASNTDLLVLTPGAGSSADLRDFLESAPIISILILVADDLEPALILPVLSGRAWGILTLEASAEELGAAIHALAAGLLVGMPALVNPLIGDLPTKQGEQLIDPLTDRENEVLQSLAQGLANKQIALHLGISEHTVKFHISSIYTKLGVTNRTAAVRLGVRWGLITL